MPYVGTYLILMDDPLPSEFKRDKKPIFPTLESVISSQDVTVAALTLVESSIPYYFINRKTILLSE